MPLAKVAHLLQVTFGLQIAPGGLAHVLHRAAAPGYTEQCEQVRNAPVVTPDETGWACRRRAPLAVGVCHPEATVYAICPGRGFDVFQPWGASTS